MPCTPCARTQRAAARAALEGRRAPPPLAMRPDSDALWELWKIWAPQLQRRGIRSWEEWCWYLLERWARHDRGAAGMPLARRLELSAEA